MNVFQIPPYGSALQMGFFVYLVFRSETFCHFLCKSMLAMAIRIDLLLRCNPLFQTECGVGSVSMQGLLFSGVRHPSPMTWC